MKDHTVVVQEANRNQAKGNEPTETRATTVCAATTGSTRNAGKKDAKGLVPNQPVSSVQRCVIAAIIRSHHSPPERQEDALMGMQRNIVEGGQPNT